MRLIIYQITKIKRKLFKLFNSPSYRDRYNQTKAKSPSVVFFHYRLFSPHLMISMLQTQILKQQDKFFSFHKMFAHIHKDTHRSIQSICISKYNSYSSYTKSRHEELCWLTWTRTTGQTMQSLDNTHERHQISTTEVTSAVQPIGTNGLKKAENHNPQKMHLIHNQEGPTVTNLETISECSIVTF